eukprot:2335936-Rhodomonas_salina.3
MEGNFIPLCHDEGQLDNVRAEREPGLQQRLEYQAGFSRDWNTMTMCTLILPPSTSFIPHTAYATLPWAPKTPHIRRGVHGPMVGEEDPRSAQK